MVSRAAMTTLAHLYVHLQRKMDQEVESTACVLLHKAGESSQFIREDVEAALSMMVQNCSPGRVLHALLTCGLSHRNAAVRRCTAQHLEKLACLLGASRLLNGKKDFTCRFLTAISKLALDSAQEVRLHARTTLRFLGGHKDFLKMVEKFVPPRDKTSIKDIITKSRGLRRKKARLQRVATASRGCKNQVSRDAVCENEAPLNASSEVQTAERREREAALQESSIPLLIHGHTIEEYQTIYHSVVDSMVSTTS
ncbi:hypothetical protein MHYP_G00300050 [Metynnis hypsauchen]